ncbi:hypothetical protein Tco_0644218 [Tanacetum coccineum]
MCILIVPQQNTGFILDSDMEGKNEESYKFPIAVQQSFNSLWSQDVRGDPDSGIGGHWRSSDSGMYKFILILRALAVFRFRRALAVFRFRHAFTKNGIACIYLEGPPHHDFSLMDILPGKSTSAGSARSKLWLPPLQLRLNMWLLLVDVDKYSGFKTNYWIMDLLTKGFDAGRLVMRLSIRNWGDRMERAATTASSLEAKQDSGNINRTQSMATLNESSP